MTAMHLENFDLNLLVAIDALHRRQSVTSAADELHITQSAMSSALKRARLHFDDDIFFYDGQRMVPTAFGTELAKRIPDLIAQLRTLVRMRVTTQLSDLKRQFTIIASDYVSAAYISFLIRRLNETAPDVSITVVPFTQRAIEEFRRGVIDFLLAPEFAFEAGFDATPIFRDDFQCVMCRSNPLATGDFSVDRFFESPHVITEFFLENGKSHFERWLEAQGRDIKVAAALPSFVVLPHFVTGTLNIATIHSRLVKQFEAIPDLVFRAPPLEIPTLQEYLVTSRNHHHDAEAKIFASYMIDIAKELEASA